MVVATDMVLSHDTPQIVFSQRREQPSTDPAGDLAGKQMLGVAAIPKGMGALGARSGWRCRLGRKPDLRRVPNVLIDNPQMRHRRVYKGFWGHLPPHPNAADRIFQVNAAAPDDAAGIEHIAQNAIATLSGKAKARPPWAMQPENPSSAPESSFRCRTATIHGASLTPIARAPADLVGAVFR